MSNEIAAQIWATVDTLNTLLKNAAAMGLVVHFNEIPYRTIEMPVAQIILEASIYKPVRGK